GGGGVASSGGGGACTDPRGYTAKIADLGLARTCTGEAAALSSDQWGALAYLAPEAAKGSCCKASDVYRCDGCAVRHRGGAGCAEPLLLGGAGCTAAGWRARDGKMWRLGGRRWEHQEEGLASQATTTHHRHQQPSELAEQTCMPLSLLPSPHTTLSSLLSPPSSLLPPLSSLRTPPLPPPALA
ncbi:hypothetical protein Agub_g558, partial [Astrephomene gubernaculifera]